MREDNVPVKLFVAACILFIVLSVTLFESANTRSLLLTKEQTQVGETIFPCHRVPGMLANATTPWEVNRLRRKLALVDPLCMEEHFPIFAQAFRARHGQSMKQLHLHVPKAGGTTLCSLAKENGLYHGKDNCWEPHGSPFWFWGEQWFQKNNVSMEYSCQDLLKSPNQLMMNENFLDFPLCPQRAYAINVREPVSRAISHVNHLLHKSPAVRNENNQDMNVILDLVQSNYMTWSLTAGRYTNSSQAKRFRPCKEDVWLAQDVLSGFDFILDWWSESQSGACQSAILHFMGMKDVQVKMANAADPKYKADFSKNSYEMMNALDTQVYEAALKWMEVDCDFFLRLHLGAETASDVAP